MFVVTLEAEPTPKTEQADQTGGAYAVCWINFPLQDGSEHLAKFYVEQAGWLPKDTKRILSVDETYYDTQVAAEERDELKSYFL